MLPQTKLDKLPRMADFALWATACETALWPAGTFWSAYCGNRDDAVEGVIDADPIAAAVRGVIAARTEWTGTASDLLGALAEVAGERVAKSKTWPDSPWALAGRLRRAATFLRKIGIEISFEREGRARTRNHPHCDDWKPVHTGHRRAKTVRTVRTARNRTQTPFGQRLRGPILHSISKPSSFERCSIRIWRWASRSPFKANCSRLAGRGTSPTSRTISRAWFQTGNGSRSCKAR